MNFKEGLKYNKDHSWVEIKKDIAIIGVVIDTINDADEVVFVNLPSIGDKIEVGSEYLEIESSKASITLTSPVKGEVIEVNKEVFVKPTLLNEDCFANFICKVKFEELDDLLEFKEAKKYYEEKK
ncbi:MAG: glycine cleavage system protein H [Candidatus Woesearchaeota archaeon]